MQTHLITVVVCTRNRAEDTMGCVDQLASSSGSEALEIIVVDNDSSAEQSALLQSWAKERSRVQLVSEPVAGLSVARNHGLRLAKGTWIAYLDDDAVPFSDWPSQALRIVASADERLAFVAGAVLPLWPESASPGAFLPQSVGVRVRGLLSILERQPSSADAELPNVVGCNMLLRASVLREVGGFSTVLGRTPGSLLGGEETDVAERLHQRRYRVAFDDTLRVYHRIHPERLTQKWIAKRAFAEGRLNALRTNHLRLLPMAKISLTLPILGAAFGADLMRSSTTRDGDLTVRFWHNLGFLKESLTLRRPRFRHRREVSVMAGPDFIGSDKPAPSVSSR